MAPDFIQQMLSKRGVKSQLLDSKTEGTPAAVYGEVIVPNAKQTIVFYAHYDGQPVNPEKWHPAIKPFLPVFLSKPIDKGGEIIPLIRRGGRRSLTDGGCGGFHGGGIGGLCPRAGCAEQADCTQDGGQPS